MPYKRKGGTVYVRRSGKWHVKKTYTGQGAAAKAEKYRKALEANVKHK
jgi:hypothetical protein